MCVLAKNTQEMDCVSALLENLFKIYNLSGCGALWDQSLENDVRWKLTGLKTDLTKF